VFYLRNAERREFLLGATQRDERANCVWLHFTVTHVSQNDDTLSENDTLPSGNAGEPAGDVLLPFRDFGKIRLHGSRTDDVYVYGIAGSAVRLRTRIPNPESRIPSRACRAIKRAQSVTEPQLCSSALQVSTGDFIYLPFISPHPSDDRESACLLSDTRIPRGSRIRIARARRDWLAVICRRAKRRPFRAKDCAQKRSERHASSAHVHFISGHINVSQTR